MGINEEISNIINSAIKGKRLIKTEYNFYATYLELTFEDDNVLIIEKVIDEFHVFLNGNKIN